MSVIVRGMAMPKDGYVCLKVFANGEVQMTKVHRGALVITGIKDKVGTAVPVPPHGRLGDLDKLENGLRHMAKYQYGERQQGILGCCETIRLAPTIIEADPAEEAE